MVRVHFDSLFFNLKLNKQKQDFFLFFSFVQKKEEILAGFFFLFMGKKLINDFNKCFPFVSGHDTPLSADSVRSTNY